MKLTLIERMQNGNAVCHVYNGLTQDFIGTIRKLKVGKGWTDEQHIYSTKNQAAKALWLSKSSQRNFEDVAKIIINADDLV